ncbi:hypothetical protein FEE96_19510 [Parasedimentitalea maritima]|uniref:Uncharacterized protein n=1 Tax=Parasedimentitalea maritima TaxID=2578117 RepID=A0ABY2UQU5_9RHOB|nr:hypothetical protein [Zongyanglinia marina]TLP57567.1 hypothetical protein FEE96_19510 [Zongyanglinia marina]
MAVHQAFEFSEWYLWECINLTECFDHYEEARELARLLAKTKLDHHGAALISAIAEAATGTEVFFGLKSNLHALLREREFTGDTRLKAERLLKMIVKSLS